MNETKMLVIRSPKLPEALKEELRALLFQVRHEGMDLVICIDGPEGSGKSRTSRVIGAFCANELKTPFGPANVHYGTEEYMRASNTYGQFTVHILDEAGVILHRASANTREARRFTKYLQVAREGNNQVHIIVLPAYHVLDGYIVNWRMRFCMHMYTEKKEDATAPGGKRTSRGPFKIFPKTEALTACWNLHQDRKIFKYPAQWFMHDRIPNCEVFTDEELEFVRAKKEKWRTSFIADEAKPGRATPKQKKAIVALLKLLKENTTLTDSEIGKEIGYGVDMIRNIRQSGGEM